MSNMEEKKVDKPVRIKKLFRARSEDDIMVRKKRKKRGHRGLQDEDMLISSAQYGYIEGVKKMLAKGMDVNLCHGITLYWASCYNQLNIVKYLLASKADINAHDPEQVVVSLRGAARNGATETVQYLLEAKADVAIGGHDALLEAKEKGYDEITKMLIDAGAQ